MNKVVRMEVKLNEIAVIEVHQRRDGLAGPDRDGGLRLGSPYPARNDDANPADHR